MNEVYGKLREEDVPVLESAIQLFKKRNLQSGLHGTSLWNANYKDVDLLVSSQSNDIEAFKEALEELKKEHSGEVIGQKGNETIGLDYDIKIGNMILHVSYVVLL